MRLGIVGGALQGIEAAYLAKKAGYDTIVIDRRKTAPALSLADEAVVLDVEKHEPMAKKVLSQCDAVIPANENLSTLVALDKMFREISIPFIFDLSAYKLSSSKALSNRYLEGLNVPTPARWPYCGLPVIVKPSGQSGSVGVAMATNEAEVERGERRVRELGDEAIIQEFVEGTSISIEVIGDGEKAVPLTLTEVVTDDTYDCRMVRCPVDGLDRGVAESFSRCARKIAEGLRLRGIMDVEAIVHNDIPKVLEIDARIPSQTPIAVYHATGLNMVELLVKAVACGELDENPPVRNGASIYEHIAVDDGSVRSCGEGIFSEVRQPRIQEGLFGSDEMITDFSPDKKSWRATIICAGPTAQSAWSKRVDCIGSIMRQNDLAGCDELHAGVAF